MARQKEFNLYKGSWGGRRPGAGRKRRHSEGVAHLTREQVTKRTALHVNFKLACFIRNKRCLQLLKRSIANARKQGLRVLHFSLQSNHVHLILEADHNAILTKGMRSLCITFAKGIGRGRVQIERYHLHVLRSLRETRHAVHYVLFNQQKHAKLNSAYMDEFSSLGLIRDLSSLAKSARMTVIWKQIKNLPQLSNAEGWMIQRVLNQS
jgi:REP element-mobilizing transposase RayT